MAFFSIRGNYSGAGICARITGEEEALQQHKEKHKPKQASKQQGMWEQQVLSADRHKQPQVQHKQAQVQHKHAQARTTI